MTEEAFPVVQEATKTKYQKPKRYHVIFLNDDFTPMDYVVEVLRRYFEKTAEDAVNIMVQVHKTGRGIAGTYSYEVADQKQSDVMQDAFQAGHPLRCVVEEAPSDSDE